MDAGAYSIIVMLKLWQKTYIYVNFIQSFEPECHYILLTISWVQVIISRARDTASRTCMIATGVCEIVPGASEIITCTREIKKKNYPCHLQGSVVLGTLNEEKKELENGRCSNITWIYNTSVVTVRVFGNLNNEKNTVAIHGKASVQSVWPTLHHISAWKTAAVPSKKL